MDGFYKDVITALRKAGYVKIKGGKGSHEKWRNEDLERSIIVPRNLKSKPLASKILKDAQVDERF